MTKSKTDETIAFRIPIDINNKVESLKHHFTIPGKEGSRTDVGRSLFMAILDDKIIQETIDTSIRKGQSFAETLRQFVNAGIEASRKKNE